MQRHLNSALCGLFLAIMWATLFSEVTKKITGRPRPNFIALCEYVDGRCRASVWCIVRMYVDTLVACA